MKAAWYPKATKLNQGYGGGEYVGGPPRLVFHTTEGTSWDGHKYYHIGFREVNGVIEVRQWRTIAEASRALFNGPDPVQTNRQGDVCINVAIIGYAKDSSNLSGAMKDALAQFIEWAHDEWDIPYILPINWCGSEGYGTGGDCRLTISEWISFTGICGHQHVPDDNTHWDPGHFPIEDILERISMATFADVPEDHKYYDDIEWMYARGITKGAGKDVKGNLLFKPGGLVTREQMAAFLHRYDRQ